MNHLYITGSDLTLEQVMAVANEEVFVSIDENAYERIDASASYVLELVRNKEVVYGITTGFGKFSNIVVTDHQIEEMQANLIRSHACGVGPMLETRIVRAVMLLRVNALIQGYSGIRRSTLQLLLDCLNHKIHPRIPQKGSLGSSGDLAPLSHMVLTMMGEGHCEYQGDVVPSLQALESCGLEPVSLVAKEGLALINGTQVLTAIGAVTTYEALNLLKVADIAGAMTFEALRGVKDALDPRVHRIRHHQGQMISARNITRITQDSEMTTCQGEVKVQDSYSLRCLPQIHGASKDAIEYVKDKVLHEINAVTDNPLIFVKDQKVISSGNFHGQPMALSFDFLGIALSELANASERRIERLVNPSLSELPPFLTEYGGSNSGFMIMQYTAASLVSENKVLAHPASVDSIPSSGNQEDHVSMGTIAAAKAYEIYKNVKHVLAIELLTAAQGIDLGQKKRLGKGTQVAYEFVRNRIPHVDKDRYLHPDIMEAVSWIDSKSLVETVEKAIGTLE